MLGIVIRISVIFLICLGSSFAQDYPLPYAQSASSAPAPTTYFGFDISDSLYIDGATSDLVYRDQSATSWNYAPVDPLYEACTTFTFSGAIGYEPPSGILEWYFRSYNGHRRDIAVRRRMPVMLSRYRCIC